MKRAMWNGSRCPSSPMSTKTLSSLEWSNNAFEWVSAQISVYYNQSDTNFL